MNFAFSEEQEELRKVAADFLTNKSSEAEVRRLMETEDGYDPAVWSQMAEQLGLQGLAIPEEFGGSGYSYVALCAILEEMGRRLLFAPLFSTLALAANQQFPSDYTAATTPNPTAATWYMCSETPTLSVHPAGTSRPRM